MIIYRQKAYSDYYLSYDRPSGHFRRNQDKYLIGGGSIAGATIGYISSKKSAEKKAKDKGLQEGTEEYKKAVKKHRLTRTAIGAGIGTITGAGALVGKQLYDVNHHSKKKVKLKAGDLIKVTGDKGLNISQHYAVYDGDGGFIDFSEGGIQTGNIKDFESQKTLTRKAWRKHGKGGSMPSELYEELMKDPKNVERVKLKAEPVKGKFTKKELLEKAEKLKERYTDDKYNWLDNNCEHFARELSTGKRSSTQADGLTGRIAKIFRPK